MKKLLLALLMTGVFVSMDVFAAPKGKCPAGTYSHAGASSCTSCLGNTYSSAGASTCNACPSGYVANEQHTACVQVSTDAFSQISGAALYQKCPAGTYEKKLTGKNERGGQCLPCTGNTYSSEPGSQKCKACPSGKEPNKDHTACVNKCPANAVCKDGTDSFVCKPGYYKVSNNAKTCTKCTAGYACNDEVSSKRQKCPAGSYAPAGSVYCEGCPSGTYSSDGAEKCTPCPKNATCPTQRDIFVTCKDGYYQSSSKTKACTKCPAGYECFGNKREKCPAGSYAPAGNKNPCEFCLGNTYSSAGASKCKSCPK